MILGVTGHRPERLHGYQEARVTLPEFAAKELERFQAEQKPPTLYVLTGMALGWDMAVAQAAYYLDIPYVAVVPHALQTSKWFLEDKKRYENLLKGAAHVVVLGEGPRVTPEHYLARDRYLVANSDMMIALWDEGQKGGTAYTVQQAKLKKVPVINVWERYIETYGKPNGR